MFLALLAGALLMLWPENSKTAENTEFPDSEEYRLRLEEQTRKLIKELEGVSDCKGDDNS